MDKRVGTMLRSLRFMSASAKAKTRNPMKRGLMMNWDRIEGNWKEYTGKAKSQWGKLTDDDLAVVQGNREQLEGRLQQHYGYAKDKAKAEIDGWLSRM